MNSLFVLPSSKGTLSHQFGWLITIPKQTSLPRASSISCGIYRKLFLQSFSFWSSIIEGIFEAEISFTSSTRFDFRVRTWCWENQRIASNIDKDFFPKHLSSYKFISASPSLILTHLWTILSLWWDANPPLLPPYWFSSLSLPPKARSIVGSWKKRIQETDLELEVSVACRFFILP